MVAVPQTHVENLLLSHVLCVWKVVFSSRVEHVRHNSTRRNSIDGDLLVATVFSQTPDKSVDRPLGSRVERMLGHRKAIGGIGAHQDDAPALRKVLVGFPCDEELSTRVDTKHAIKFFL